MKLKIILFSDIVLCSRNTGWLTVPISFDINALNFKKFKNE
jgi:hypothetical protein